MLEVWKPILGFEGLYEISSLGRVKTVEREVVHSCGKVQKVREKIRTPQKHPTKGQTYQSIQLYRNSEITNRQVHRLVAQAFIPNPENKPQVNHIDNNAQNNHADNLEWVTAQENSDHAWNTGQHDYRFKKVIRKSSDGLNEIFNSVTEGAKSVSANYTMGVSNACKSGGTYKGYTWNYLKDEPATTIESIGESQRSE